MFFGPSVRIEDHTIYADYPRDVVVESTIFSDGKVQTSVLGTSIFEKSGDEYVALPNREVKRQLYRVLSEVTRKRFPWGSLTGIRPTIVAREVQDPGLLAEFYSVREDKAQLALETAQAEDRILETTGTEDMFVYVGIPFCPGRCSYCSFITQECRASAELLVAYRDTVLREIAGLSGMFRNVKAVYFGGGTPTIMEDEMLFHFIDKALDRIRPDRNAEITVEAGRPDTLSEAKAERLRQAGVGRICVNPQTLSDETLIRIGRRHTADQFFEAFSIARKAGFPVINTDLIAGLPGEPLGAFQCNVDRIIGLSPENVTIHALCKKRTSNLKREDILDDPVREGIADGMITYAVNRLEQAGYSPYYLYKQKDTVGGLENTGFSLRGKECLYNVAMMSDCRNVLALGAGGVSKKIFENGRAVRHDCVRNVKDYIQNIDKIIEGKIRFFEV